MTKQDRINLVILALKAAGFNDDLTADGCVGPQAKKACKVFANTPLNKKDEITMVQCALKFAGFDKDLVINGLNGIQIDESISNFLDLEK